MTRAAFTIEPNKGYQPRKIGVRVTASPTGYPGPSAQVTISGTLTVEEARTLATDLSRRADEVEARNQREDETERKRRVRMASLPIISLR